MPHNPTAEIAFSQIDKGFIHKAYCEACDNNCNKYIHTDILAGNSYNRISVVHEDSVRSIRW